MSRCSHVISLFSTTQATGCGKTHTISGNEDDPGIIYLTMADLFREIDERREDNDIDVVVTFLEIYNEEIRDLLADSSIPTQRGGLQIREDKSVKVVGLQELRPRSADEVKEIVILGNTRRTQSPTHANETSSRSHAVLQVHITQAPRTAAIHETRTMATLSIIDLAGSERAAATLNMGKRMVEGANINKSLLALGNCINALCESGGAVRHVPYRNSKLTRLLKFSLGGNCKTVMIVCVAPTSANFDDTHNTLIYAERATKIRTKVVTRNVVNVDRHVGQYVEAINRLNAQVEELKAQLAGKRDAEAEKEKRRRRDAAGEVDKAKRDLQQKADQTRAQILDGAACTGKLDVAEAKLGVIRARLTELETSGAKSADVEAERGLLRALAGPEENALKPNSELRTRVLRSGNSDAMFEATLRAVRERRSDKLDDVSVENVRLDAHVRQAEMEQKKAEARRDALKKAVADEAHSVVSLVGLVGRCTVMLAEASRLLAKAAEGETGLADTVKTISGGLQKVADGNDAAFKSLLGFTASEYAVGPAPTLGFDPFKSFPISRRATSGPTLSVPMQSTLKPAGRRASSFGSSVAASPLRKSYRSPRKSLRSSMASGPYRRMSDKKKGVQWVDEVGRGDIDDGGFGHRSTSPVIAVIPPSDRGIASSASISQVLEPSPSTSRDISTPGPSEGEWEDEKTEEDNPFDVSYSANTSARVHNLHRLSSASNSGESHVMSGKRPRASRLDPGFLKSRGARSPALGSVIETDEERSSPMKSPLPLGDRNMNRAQSPTSSTSGSSVGKGKATRSPAKRVPATPKVLNANKLGRRKSQIGPVRVERSKRRASQIPQLSPKFRSSLGESAPDAGPSGTSISAPVGARRVEIPQRSPAKRSRRMSVLNMNIGATALRSAARPKTSDASIILESTSNLRMSSKPSWR